MITRQRAVEIMRQCQELAQHGPWSDQLFRVLTPQENADIREQWDTMPGYTCYYDAFCAFLNGKVKPGPDGDKRYILTYDDEAVASSNNLSALQGVKAEAHLYGWFIKSGQKVHAPSSLIIKDTTDGKDVG